MWVITCQLLGGTYAFRLGDKASTTSKKEGVQIDIGMKRGKNNRGRRGSVLIMGYLANCTLVEKLLVACCWRRARGKAGPCIVLHRKDRLGRARVNNQMRTTLPTLSTAF